MNPALQPLERMLRLQTRLFENCLDEVDDDKAQERPNERTNHLAFLACHVVDARFFLARLLGGDAASPFPDLEQVRKVEEVRVVPTLTQIRRAWSTGTAVLLEQLGVIPDAELATKPEPAFPIEDGTLLGAITFLVHHEAFHIGQMALVRKFLGLGPMRYA